MKYIVISLFSVCIISFIYLVYFKRKKLKFLNILLDPNFEEKEEQEKIKSSPPDKVEKCPLRESLWDNYFAEKYCKFLQERDKK